jgi:hypothetical protein
MREKLAAVRRDFLHLFSAAFTGGPFVEEAAADTEKNDEKPKSRYSQTDHVNTFYRVNRYPS